MKLIITSKAEDKTSDSSESDKHRLVPFVSGATEILKTASIINYALYGGSSFNPSATFALTAGVAFAATPTHNLTIASAK